MHAEAQTHSQTVRDVQARALYVMEWRLGLRAHYQWLLEEGEIEEGCKKKKKKTRAFTK